ncbi:MAG: phosphomannomutase/phosphoglucomutase, partial [Burkholderiaceae bacterium]|nr:phosphomannomutase/phosphoglucomutase [Burkholderiaceae bacterium]
MLFQEKCFKAYDIRGTVPEQLTPEFAWALGLVFGRAARSLGETTVAVGRDGRLSGPSLSEALCSGLAAAGVAVIDIGLATTPMLYFAAHTLCSTGIQITGSHNPKNYNGFKMVLAGEAIYGDTIQALRAAMNGLSEDDRRLQPASADAIQRLDIAADYGQRVVADIQLSRPMKIVVDSGNGVAGATAPGIFRALGCDVVALFSEVDGNFPNHH